MQTQNDLINVHFLARKSVRCAKLPKHKFCKITGGRGELPKHNFCEISRGDIFELRVGLTIQGGVNFASVGLYPSSELCLVCIQVYNLIILT